MRELVRRRGLDPILDCLELRQLIDEVVSDDDERAMTSTLSPLNDSRIAARAVYDAVAGLDPLQRHLEDPRTNEPLADGYGTSGAKRRPVSGPGCGRRARSSAPAARRASRGCSPVPRPR